jgi:hypothetical protein
MRLRPAVLIALAVVLVAASPAAASGSRICVPVEAQGAGQDNGDFTTDATITTRGILLGRTHAEFTPTATGFTGPIVFTTAVGTLTAQVNGSFDLATGAFQAQSTSVTGRGAFRRVTGDIRIAGLEDLGTGAFTETISGRLCARF